MAEQGISILRWRPAQLRYWGLKEKISGESLLRLASFGDPGFLGLRGRSRGGRSSPTACGRSGAFYSYHVLVSFLPEADEPLGLLHRH